MKFKPAIGILLFTLFFASVSGQEANKKEIIKIATSAQCEMCKTRIETAMAYEKGVVKSNLDLETKILTVTYKTGKTTPEQIRKAISMVGYDADDVPADPKAYSELSPCCKKPEDPEHTNH